MILLRDEETGTYWDHITGKAVHGPLQGHQLETWSVTISDVATALTNNPAIRFAKGGLQKRSLKDWLIYLVFQTQYRGKVSKWLSHYPPGFRATMSEVDSRLPEHTTGLGVFENNLARFYPIQQLNDGAIEDRFADKVLRVKISAENNIPFAQAVDGPTPKQLFSRWYGFSLTFPHTSIYEAKK